MMRDPSTPTMGDTGELANVAIGEGGRAEGSLGQVCPCWECVYVL